MSNKNRIAERRVAGLLGLAFDAEDGHCGQLLLTSYPAKMELRFRIEKTFYTTRIEMDTRYDRLVPAVDRR